MASQWPPKKNTAFTLYFTLYKNDGTVIANPGTITKKVSIDGGAVADITAAITEEDTTYGQCSVVLSTSEMNGDGIWVFIKDDTPGCVPFTCTLYPAANTQDEVGASVAAILADTGTDGVVVAAASKTGYALSAAGVLAIWDQVTSALTAAGSIGKKLADWVVGTIDTYTGNTKQTGDAYARLGAPAGASVSADVAAVKGETASLLTRLTATRAGYLDQLEHIHDDTDGAVTKLNTIIGYLDTEIAAILAAVDTEVAAIKGKTDNLPANPAAVGSQMDLVNAPNATAVTAIQLGLSKPGTAQTITAPADMALNSTVAKDATVAKEASLLNAAGIRSAVGLAAANLDTQLDALPTAAEIKTALEADGSKLDHLWEMTEDDGGVRRLTTNALEQAPTGGSAPTAAAIADAVWDELIADHLGAGKTGAALNAAGSAGDPWTTPLPGAYGAGTAGKIIGDNINAPIGTVDTVVDAIKVVVDNIHDTDLPDLHTDVAAVKAETALIVADTNELQTDLVNGGRLDLLVDGIKAKTDGLPSGITKNVELANFEFLMVLATDHITPATLKTITAMRSIDGGAFAPCANAAAEVGSGIYKITLAAADLNGDVVTFKFSEAACDARYVTIKTE